MSQSLVAAGAGPRCRTALALLSALGALAAPRGAAAEPRPTQSRIDSLRFDWPALTCPDRQSVVDSLASLDLAARDPLGDEEPLPQAAAIDPTWVEAHVVQAQQADGGEPPALRLELVMHARNRTIARVVTVSGPCAERAAVIAAIIERAIRPAAGADAVTAAPPELQEFEVTLAPQGEPQAPASSGDDPGDDEPATEDTSVALGAEREPLWILNGTLVVLGGEGPTFRAGADAELRYEFSWDLFAVFRLSYRSPRVSRVGPATVRVDDAWAAVGLQIGSPHEAIALQTSAMVQVVWSHGDGLQKEYNVVSANPGITVGACYQKAFTTWGFEGCARGFGFLRRQEIHVNDAPVLGLPRVGGELAIGVSYQL